MDGDEGGADSDGAEGSEGVDDNDNEGSKGTDDNAVSETNVDITCAAFIEEMADEAETDAFETDAFDVKNEAVV